jgi:hypothetical protein
MFLAIAFFFLVLEFELRALTLNHSTILFLWVVLRRGLVNYLPGLASNCDPPVIDTNLAGHFLQFPIPDSIFILSCI